MVRVTTCTPSTPLVVFSGSIGNINDNNPLTVCEVIGVVSTDFWFVLDIGQVREIIKVELKQWYETITGDSGYTFQYSNSMLNTGNVGTAYGASFSASTSPQDTSQTGDISARYFGLLRAGNFLGNDVGVGDFNLYAPDFFASVSPSRLTDNKRIEIIGY